MFERFKKIVGLGAEETDSAGRGRTAGAAPPIEGPLSEWAGTQGFQFDGRAGSGTCSVKGLVEGRDWRIEVGPPSREFIRGEELRARSELGTDEFVSVLLMNRHLKESLETKAYAIYTDTLQTRADPKLPEEMRWLAVYEEMAWEGPPDLFWQHYCVLADHREHATAWVDEVLVRQLLNWPDPSPSPDTPFVLMLMRGKAYLRMQYEPADMPTLQHAAAIYLGGCETALRHFKKS